MADHPRDARSRFLASPKQVEEELFCYNAKLAGLTYDQIRDAFPEHFGYTMSKSTIIKRVRDKLSERLAENEEARDRLRQMELDKLLAQETRLHTMTGAVRVLPHGTRAPRDEAVRLAAEEKLLSNWKRRAALLGIDAPAQVEVEVQAVDPATIELRAKLLEIQKRQAERLGATPPPEETDDAT